MIDTVNVSRKCALFRLGKTAASTAIPAVGATLAASKDDEGYFTHPSEYVDAIHAAGMTAVAGFHYRKDGSVHPMGVFERLPEDARVDEVWRKRQSIGMHIPIQRAADTPQGRWWNSVWQYLYDKGLREDVTPRRARIHGRGEA
jgi:hypothetical protein